MSVTCLCSFYLFYLHECVSWACTNQSKSWTVDTLDEIFQFWTAEDIIVTFSPIWSLLFVETHTLHVLAKYHTLRNIECYPASEPEISHNLALSSNTFDYLLIVCTLIMQKDETIRWKKENEDEAVAEKISWTLLVYFAEWTGGVEHCSLAVSSRTPAIVERVCVWSVGMNNWWMNQYLHLSWQEMLWIN